MVVRKRTWRLILLMLATLLVGCTPTSELSDTPVAGVRNELVLASGTTIYDSGLLDAILPDFERKTGIRVRVIPVGTGQALALGKAGDADVVLVHDAESEEKFVADGYAPARYEVMRNDFIIVGPASDPAGIRGLTDALQLSASSPPPRRPLSRVGISRAPISAK